MKTTKLSFLMDMIFYFTLFFLLGFVWVRYFVHQKYLILVVCLLSALFCLLVVIKIKSTKSKKISISKTDKEKAKQFSEEMFYLTEKEQCEKIVKILSSKKYEIKKGAIFFNDIAIKPIYVDEICKKMDLVKSFSKLKNEKISKVIFVSNNFSEEAKNFKNNFNDILIKTINENEIYSLLLKPLNYVSPLKKQVKQTKLQYIKSLLKLAFNNKKTKTYVFYAIILFLFSFLYRYNLYYIIACSIFIIFAIFSRFNKIYNTAPSEKTFFD